MPPLGRQLGCLPLVCAAASIVTFAFYAWDKRAAVRGGRRVTERTLHALAFLCGWPGALAAQALLRHKHRKLAFVLMTRLLVLINGVLVVWLIYDPAT